MLASILFGIAEMQSYRFFGHSGVRSVAAVAVTGCLLAAIGHFEE